MLLDTLGRIRLRTSATLERSQESIVDGEEISSGRQSIRSTAPSTSSLTSSPSGRSAK
jgi:serine/arginine repetitive matrix protein 2